MSEATKKPMGEREPNLTYETANIEGIIKWCVDNNQVPWLKAHNAKNIPVYEKLVDENGDVVKKDGKPVFTDKVLEYRKPSFFELKVKFFDTFLPDQKPVAKSKNKKNIWDLIDEL